MLCLVLSFFLILSLLLDSEDVIKSVRESVRESFEREAMEEEEAFDQEKKRNTSAEVQTEVYELYL